MDIVVTNHALLAIDALEEFGVLPEHDVVIIDEAHDLVNRVTSAASAELSAPAMETAARRGGRVLSAEEAAPLREAAEAADRVLAGVPAGRIDDLPPRWPARSPPSATRPAPAPHRCGQRRGKRRRCRTPGGGAGRPGRAR